MSDEFVGEPLSGLPQRPPAGETILWQGAPQWRATALRTFHVRKVALYFAALFAWGVLDACSMAARRALRWPVPPR